MGGLSSPLYDEFLDHYHLDPAMYMHALEISKKHFAKIDTLKVLTFKKVQIPVSEAVKNSVTFRNELHMSQITAERELKKILHSFRQFRMDEDDVGMMCDRLEMAVIYFAVHLGWYFVKMPRATMFLGFGVFLK